MSTPTPVHSARQRRRFGTRGRLLIGILALATVGVACASDPAPPVDPEAYRSELSAICANTARSRAGLTDPIDAASTTAFAQDVATILTDEADAVRLLQVPSDLAADHRAFIQNTDDQARQWTVLATTSVDDSAAFGAISDSVLQLTLGRDDLAVDMGVDGCRIAAPAT